MSNFGGVSGGLFERLFGDFLVFFLASKNFQDVKNSRVCFKKRASLERHISKMGSTVGPCVETVLTLGR